MLASGFSHEMNTPLATVLTCVEGILHEARRRKDEGGEWGEIAESASIAREQILRCRGITQHFLRLSRNQPTPGDLVDVGRTVASVARLVEPTAREHAVTVVAAPVQDGLHVRVDEAEFQHTLINLLLNGIQACRPGGRVTLAADADSHVHVRVTDDGCGIAPDDQKRIFEPFFSMRKGGTGLGLFLSLNFVRGWGGDIVISSVLGRGSTFDVVLPPVVTAEARSA
jgi:signal transduction histidine kinase